MNETALIIETIVKAVIVLAVTAGMGAFATFIERKGVGIYATPTWTDACGALWSFTTCLWMVLSFLRKKTLSRNMLLDLYL